MRDFGDIEAVRLFLYTNSIDSGEIPAKVISIEKRPDPWHIAIIRESVILSDYARDLSKEVIQLFQNEIDSRAQRNGRQIELAHPVQLSYGISQTAKLLDSGEEKLNKFRRNLEFYADKATFQSDSYTEEFARVSLSISWRIIEQTRLTLQTYMWMQWIAESVGQASQFGALIQNSNYFPDHTVDSFGYIAHPPLVVATLSCTAMIEEVGAEYINKITNMSVHPDETRCIDILGKIERSDLQHDQIDIDSIKSTVVNARNELAHYISSRGQVVTVESFQEYYLAIWNGLLLVRRLLNELLADTFQREADLLDSVSEAIE